MSNVSTLSPCMEVLSLWLNCLFSTWMWWKLVLLQPKAKYLLFYSRYIEVVKIVLQPVSCKFMSYKLHVGLCSIAQGKNCLIPGGSLNAAACALHPVPLAGQMMLSQGLQSAKRGILTLNPVKLSSNSAPDPRRWRVLVDLPLAAAKVGTAGTVQEEEESQLCWALLGQYLKAPGIPWGWAAIKDVLPIVDFCFKSFNICFLWFYIFYFGISFSYLPSVRKLYSFHKSHYNLCQATPSPCSSCIDLPLRESMNQDLKYFQGVHPGYIKSTIFSESSFQSSDPHIWFTNRRYLRRAFSKLAYYFHPSSS